MTTPSYPFRTLLALLILVLSPWGAAAQGIPFQWLAKQYSEGLGRGPDPGGWKTTSDFFQASGCNQANLKDSGRIVLTSGEFESKGYNNAQRVFVAYRAILSREPDQGGFNDNLSCLNAGTCTWEGVIDAFYDSSEFSSLVPAICTGSHYRDDMGGNRPIDIPGNSRSAEDIQRLLNIGGTVCLNPQEVIYLDRTLVVPSGVRLETCDAAGTETARFGRLVRDNDVVSELVVLQGTIDRVWIDGQRGRFPYRQNDINVDARGGTLINSRIAESRGWTNVRALHTQCNGATPVITNNLITGYTTPHSGFKWADGLSLFCNGTYAANNFIIDATDVGVIVFARGTDSGPTSSWRETRYSQLGGRHLRRLSRAMPQSCSICRAPILSCETTSCGRQVLNTSTLGWPWGPSPGSRAQRLVDGQRTISLRQTSLFASGMGSSWTGCLITLCRETIWRRSTTTPIARVSRIRV